MARQRVLFKECCVEKFSMSLLAILRDIASSLPPSHSLPPPLTTLLDNTLRVSPVVSIISLSASCGAMSTSSSEKQPTHLNSPTASVGVVGERLMEVEPEKDRWRRVPHAARPLAPTVPEAVFVKLHPGQAIEMEMHAIEGIGKDHAKFSPFGALLSAFPLSLFLKNRVCFAATACYRLLPHIILDEASPVPPHLATRFWDFSSPRVINVDARTKKVCQQAWGARRLGIDGSRGVIPSRPCGVRQVNGITLSVCSFSNALACLGSQRRVRGP